METLTNYIQPLSIEIVVLCWFITFILSEAIGIAYYFKKIFRIKQTKNIKILYCYPCFSFWITLIISLNLYVAIIVFFIAYKIDKQNGN